ncbi:MAG: ImmA/IrrE family metallo-endopeptidase [Bacteroidota bacterium]|nr:ImmA/IrrE family metallo-endopeptidase [Bacteroidota bacterium]
MANINERILEVRANRFREKLGLGSCDPVPVPEVLSELNVLTNFRELSRNFSGMALKTRDDMCMILINSNQIRARQNFTIGHELYHLFIQENFSFMICNAGRFDKKDREEYNADVFSSCLLMPEAGILNLIPETELGRGGEVSLPTIVKLEQFFGVSRSALLIRLDKLGLIDYQSYAERYKTGIKRSAYELGYPVWLYESGSDYNLIGDYGSVSKKLFEEEKISESHYFSLMSDVGVNIDEQFAENDEPW